MRAPDATGGSGLLELAWHWWQRRLYPVYVRGLAFLAEHKGPQAAAEFQKILNHPGIALAEIIVHLGLARARALEGDKAGSRKTYQDFLALWQHADPNIPFLKQAKSEYAKPQ